MKIVKLLQRKWLITYTYDAWGNFTPEYNYDSELGQKVGYAVDLPFRYRSYYYDSQTGFYYLNSRYYDSKLCRFINADGYVSTGQGLTATNMFVYCGNNPVMYADYFGCLPQWLENVANWVDDSVIQPIANTIPIYRVIKDLTELDELEATVSDEEVTVINSYKIDSLLVNYGYSIYLNHFNKKTRDVIKGASFGVTYEWALHNIGYDIGNLFGIGSLVSSGEVLTVGATVYNDYEVSEFNERKLFSVAMKIGYAVIGPIFDIAVYLGDK